MCGIAGIVGESSSDTGAAAIKPMLQALARRGPDDEGIARWPGALLGQRRLAVLDVSSAGHQPMLSDDGAVGLIFNGCIYNFKEIRERLKAEGMHFRSNCDTEVILRGYECWGMEKLLPQMRGMFAIAVWDSRNGKLTLVRDRLGVKPLCYAVQDGRLAFASTVGSLRAAQFGGELSAQAILNIWNSDSLPTVLLFTKEFGSCRRPLCWCGSAARFRSRFTGAVIMNRMARRASMKQ